MTAKQARARTDAAKNKTFDSIINQIGIAADNEQSSIIFEGRYIVDKTVIDRLKKDEYLLEYFDTEYVEKCELISIRW